MRGAGRRSPVFTCLVPSLWRESSNPTTSQLSHRESHAYAHFNITGVAIINGHLAASSVDEPTSTGLSLSETEYIEDMDKLYSKTESNPPIELV